WNSFLRPLHIDRRAKRGGRVRAVVNFLFSRKHEQEHRARTLSARTPDRTTEKLRDKIMDDVKSKSGPALRAARREKGLENPCLIIACDAAAVVAEFQLDVISVTLGDDFDLPLLIRLKPMRNGVQGQIGDHL